MNKKKLRIKRETVLELSDTDLEAVWGGRGKHDGGDSDFCPTTPNSQTGCCPATSGTACTCRNC